MPERPLPPGQRYLQTPMPRYGLPKYVRHWVSVPEPLSISVRGAVKCPLVLTGADLRGLPRRSITRDFHCVTTWSVPDVTWSGYAFRDLWQDVLKDVAEPKVTHVQVRALDGYRVCIPLSELLQEDVLLADSMDGEPLGVKHGAPLRLIVPQLYGYKSIKHVQALEFLNGPARNTFVSRLLIHPRGRVDLEERSSARPQRFWRWLYAWQLPNFLREAANWQEEPGRSLEKD